MKKIMLVFGTRPEAIKMCPLVLELKGARRLRRSPASCGQHREMPAQVLDVFGGSLRTCRHADRQTRLTSRTKSFLA